MLSFEHKEQLIDHSKSFSISFYLDKKLLYSASQLKEIQVCGTRATQHTKVYSTQLKISISIAILTPMYYKLFKGKWRAALSAFELGLPTTKNRYKLNLRETPVAPLKGSNGGSCFCLFKRLYLVEAATIKLITAF